VPVTKIEEIPVLTEEERAALRVALERAEASVKAGEAVEYDRKTFKDRLLAIYRGKRQAG
jgi:hypothetical protein